MVKELCKCEEPASFGCAHHFGGKCGIMNGLSNKCIMKKDSLHFFCCPFRNSDEGIALTRLYYEKRGISADEIDEEIFSIQRYNELIEESENLTESYDIGLMKLMMRILESKYHSPNDLTSVLEYCKDFKNPLEIANHENREFKPLLLDLAYLVVHKKMVHEKVRFKTVENSIMENNKGKIAMEAK